MSFLHIFRRFIQLRLSSQVGLYSKLGFQIAAAGFSLNTSLSSPSDYSVLLDWQVSDVVNILTTLSPYLAPYIPGFNYSAPFTFFSGLLTNNVVIRMCTSGVFDSDASSFRVGFVDVSSYLLLADGAVRQTVALFVPGGKSSFEKWSANEAIFVANNDTALGFAPRPASPSAYMDNFNR